MSHLPHPAGGSVFSGYVPQELLLLSLKTPVYEPATLLTGQVYEAGSVLGRITAGAVSSAAKSGGNTGNGTFVLDATNPKRLGVKAGIYALRVVELHAVHDYTVELRDPDGFSLGNYRLTGTGASITIDNDVKGVLTDGGTDFVVGDGFDITVAVGSNKLTLSAAAAEDGSAVPFAVLAERVDASAADKNCPVVVEGYFNEEALVFGAGHTADTVRVALRDRGIHMRTMRYSG
jgi:hypothetical protein